MLGQQGILYPTVAGQYLVCLKRVGPMAHGKEVQEGSTWRERYHPEFFSRLAGVGGQIHYLV